MLKRILFAMLISFMIYSAGCSSSEDNDEPFSFDKGKYKFTMSDSIGKKVIEGTLNLVSKTNNDIAGTYELTNIYDKDFPGLGTMDGNFSGNIIPADKRVFINTNPKIADANVFWNMNIKKKSVSGEWNYSTFRGSQYKGKIVIVKN